MTLAEIGVKEGKTLTPSSQGSAGASPSHQVIKYPYIDALRGYAVLLVILSHCGGMFPELPYPVKKLTNLGWTGVQLFFLISCVTLMMSWRSDERKGIASPFRFWVRRFFRIAPMYYLAALFYLFAEPPTGGFDLRQFLASLAFINAWHPVLLSTLDGGWRVVPGGWSISVEFCFYILFPLIVTFVESKRSALVFCIFSVSLACSANDYVQGPLLAKYGTSPAETFLYYWLPNQLFVFAIGTFLFFRINTANKHTLAEKRFNPLIWVTLCVVAALIIGEYPNLTPGAWSLAPFRGPPEIFYVTVLLFCIALLVAKNPKLILVNKPVRAIGTVSFSAYLCHFFIVHQLAALPIIDATHQTGFKAILACGLLFALTVPATFAVSWLTYRLIEYPMIKVGARLTECAGR